MMMLRSRYTTTNEAKLRKRVDELNSFFRDFMAWTTQVSADPPPCCPAHNGRSQVLYCPLAAPPCMHAAAPAAMV
jgi:hypothetical protein